MSELNYEAIGRCKILNEKIKALHAERMKAIGIYDHPFTPFIRKGILIASHQNSLSLTHNLLLTL